MGRRCQGCNAFVDDDRLLRCPTCKAPFSSELRAIRLAPEERDAIIRDLSRDLWRRQLRWLFGGFSILTVVSIVQLPHLWHSAVRQVETEITERITWEFEQNRIKTTVSQVAAGEAAAMLHEQVDPALQRIRNEAASASEFIGEARSTVEKLQQDVVELGTAPNLSVHGSHVDVLENGLRLVVTLMPSKIAPLGPVSMAVQLPDGSAAKILDVYASGYGSSSAFVNIQHDISDDGRTAVLVSQPLVPAAFWFHVAVTQPTDVTLYGSHQLTKTSFKVIAP